MNTGEIIIYQTKDGQTSIDVKLENETVWLTQSQIALLFDCSTDNVGLHLKNIFSEKELDQNSTTEFFSVVRQEGHRFIQRRILHYNLDAILSIGYRVSSRNATLFRVWSNKVLKEFLIKGYAINQNAKIEQLTELKDAVKLLSNVLDAHNLSADEATGLLRVITDYTYALDTLDKYDYQQLVVEDTTTDEPFRANYDNAMAAIYTLRDRFGSSGLFAHEKDESFRSSIGQIYQTFGGNELYPSVEEKAAMLLYLVTKNHSFSDGNKRIAAFLFLWFLEKNGILYKSDGTMLIGNNTLVALTLMIAESRTEENEVMVKVIVNLINRNN